MGKILFAFDGYWLNAAFRSIIIQRVVPTAASAVTHAAMARILSNALMVGAAADAVRCAAGALRGWAATGAAPVPARGAAAGAAEDRNAGAPATGGCIGAPLGAPVGPPGGSVGSLMVGAADGLGGRLMRTVSFWAAPCRCFFHRL